MQIINSFSTELSPRKFANSRMNLNPNGNNHEPTANGFVEFL